MYHRQLLSGCDITLRVKMTPPLSARTTLPDIAAVDGAADEINRVVVGQGNVGQAADESRRVLAQRAKQDAVHATCGQHRSQAQSVAATIWT